MPSLKLNLRKVPTSIRILGDWYLLALGRHQQSIADGAERGSPSGQLLTRVGGSPVADHWPGLGVQVGGFLSSQSPTLEMPVTNWEYCQQNQKCCAFRGGHWLALPIPQLKLGRCVPNFRGTHLPLCPSYTLLMIYKHMHIYIIYKYIHTHINIYIHT